MNMSKKVEEKEQTTNKQVLGPYRQVSVGLAIGLNGSFFKRITPKLSRLGEANTQTDKQQKKENQQEPQTTDGRLPFGTLPPLQRPQLEMRREKLLKEWQEMMQQMGGEKLLKEWQEMMQQKKENQQEPQTTDGRLPFGTLPPLQRRPLGGGKAKWQKIEENNSSAGENRSSEREQEPDDGIEIRRAVEVMLNFGFWYPLTSKEKQENNSSAGENRSSEREQEPKREARNSPQTDAYKYSPALPPKYGTCLPLITRDGKFMENSWESVME
ncbi:MAG: hypothetical protein QXN01_00735 [Candidatus Anstonellales archaeon]